MCITDRVEVERIISTGSGGARKAELSIAGKGRVMERRFSTRACDSRSDSMTESKKQADWQGREEKKRRWRWKHLARPTVSVAFAKQQHDQKGIRDRKMNNKLYK